MIDVGNTRLKWAISGLGSELLSLGKPALKNRGAIAALARRFPKSSVVVSCVVPTVRKDIETIFKNHALHIMSGESPYLNFGFDYPKPGELGSDRIADCAAMFDYGKFPAVSINCGTATVLNVLDKQGRFCGGLIQPGLEVIRDSIIKRAAGLRKLKLSFPGENSAGIHRSALGKSTQQAIQNGALAQFRGGIEEGLRSLARELGQPPQVYLTGGNAVWLQRDSLEHVIGTIETKALLTLEGLNIIAKRWQASQSVR